MNLEELVWLDSPEAQEALQSLASRELSESQRWPLLKNLRRHFTPAQAGLLWDQALWRRKAQSKFPQAGQMLWEPQALEQATSWELALQRAQKLDALVPPGPILDLGCGLGGQALALAQYRPVWAIDLDPLRLALLERNARQLQTPYPIETKLGDFLKMELPPAAALVADPARRQGEKRLYDPQETIPPLSELINLAERYRLPAAIKLAPSVDRQIIKDYPQSGLEFVGPHLECREAVLWLKTEDAALWEASLYRQGQWWSWSKKAQTEIELPLAPLEASQYLYEVQPTLLRAGLLGELAKALGASQFDPQVSWLTGSLAFAPAPELKPWYATFRLTHVQHFSLKALQKLLRQLEIGILEIKKRNFALEPDQLRSKIKLAPHSKREATLFLTRCAGQPLFLLGERL